MRKLLSVVALFVISLLAVSMASASNIGTLRWDSVKINGDELEERTNGEMVFAVEEGETLSIRVLLENTGTAVTDIAEDVEVEAKISGYEYGNLAESTDLFNIAAGTVKPVTLELNLPTKLDKDEYRLRLRVLDKDSTSLERTIKLAVEPVRHGLDIADVSFSPGSTVKAGRSLLTTVLLENFGEKNENDAKVTVSIPALGVSATEFVDAKTDEMLKAVEYKDVPEVFLPIPANARAGVYEVHVTAEYDRFTESVTKIYHVEVQANEMFPSEDKLVLAVGPEVQTVAPGKTATYGVALTNAGAQSKAYVLEVVSGDWATTSLSESLVVLEPGKNKIVYVDVTAAADALAGEHVASLSVKSEGNVLETVSLRSVVVVPQTAATPEAAGSSLNLRNGLEIALIILVVVLVIIGLIIGFSRLRKDDNGEEQTYY